MTPVVTHRGRTGQVIRQERAQGLQEPRRGLARLAAPQQRRWALRKGLCGLQFLAGMAGNSTGQVMRELARACWRLGIDVSVEAFPGDGPPWAATSVRHLVGRVRPPQVVIGWASPTGKHWAQRGTLLVEMDVADGWLWGRPGRVDWINREVDLLLLPSEAGREEFERAGVATPIGIVPLGVDQTAYQPWGQDWELVGRADWGQSGVPEPGTFLFLAAAMTQPRKGLPVAVEAFKRAFAPSEPVGLLVKHGPANWAKSPRELVLKQRGEHRIGLLEEGLSEWQMARLFSTADCFVNVHHREGFGLMPLQAMACGTPALVTAYDGPMSYATEANAILVAPREVGTAPKGSGAPTTAAWAMVDEDAVAAAMREAYEGAAAARVDAARAMAREWTWDKGAKALVELLEQHVTPVRRRAKARGAEAGMLTISIPARNAAGDLARALSSASQTGWAGQLELLVFDDGSEDETTKVARNWGARVIRSEAWAGESAARQVLLEEARGEFVFLTDADVEFPEPGWAVSLLQGLAGEGIIAHPLVLGADGRVQSAGGTYRDWGKLGLLPAGHRLEGEGWPGGQRIDGLVYAPTVGWFARREVLERLAPVGGYFPTIFLDVDWAFWLRAQGIAFRLVPEARIVHHAGSYTQRQEGDEFWPRLSAHAGEFRGWWDDLIEHDLAMGFGRG